MTAVYVRESWTCRKCGMENDFGYIEAADAVRCCGVGAVHVALPPFICGECNTEYDTYEEADDCCTSRAKGR